MIHGEDFAILGKGEDLEWLRKVIEKKKEVKREESLIRGCEGAVRVLKRVVSSTREGLENEADQRHAEIIVRDVRLKEHSKRVTAWGFNVESGTA